MADKTQNNAIQRYMEKNYDRLELRFRKEEKLKERLYKHCEEYGYQADSLKGGVSVASFIKKAVETQMAIDRGEAKLTDIQAKKD